MPDGTDGFGALDVATIGAQALAGLGQIVSGSKANSEAKKLAETHPDAFYNIPKEIDQNVSLAESRAGQGMSDGAMQLYRDGLNQNTAGGIDAIIKGGGSVNNIGELYGSQLKGYSNLAEVDEQQRARNIQDVIAQRQNKADELEKQWAVNIYKPVQDARQAAALLRQQGQKQISGGENTLLSTLANYKTDQLYSDRTKAINNSLRHPAVQSNPGLQPGYNGITIGDVNPQAGLGEDINSSVYSDVG